jgi:hypothetical protein
MPAHLKGVALKKWLQDEVLRLEVDGKRPDRGDGPEDTVVADAIKKHFSNRNPVRQGNSQRRLRNNPSGTFPAHSIDL